MSTKTFTSTVQIQQYVNTVIQKAIMTASVRITKELRNIIDEQYYQDPEFYPNVYRRVNMFLDSASYELIGSNMAEIGINTDEMHYYNGFDPDTVVEYAANSQHGSPLYQTDTVDFWSTFEQWCEENVIKILRQELQNQGLKLI
jgi:hypothetical protein